MLSSLEITAMLKAWSNGELTQPDEVFSHLYDALRKQAHAHLRRERAGHTLQTTGLINETYIKLREQRNFEWESRDHFFAICAILMRRILVDYARSKHREKRGGYAEHLTIDGMALADGSHADVDVLALDDALDRLAQLDPSQARIVELRYFSGFTIEETASVLGVSDSTVKREWRVAKAWLRHELEQKMQL
jgi:RNA polymerase sigma-70 factor (ECF subfamily)